MARKRPTIGLLTTMDMIHIFPSHWLGMVDAARRLGVNLLCFTGVTLRSTIQNAGFANTIFDRVSARDVDGLVVWPSALEWYVSRTEMLAFCERYQLPLVCAETPLEGFPSVKIDGRQGMREAVSHLIEVHGLRRIAFLGGPERHSQAVDRFHGYGDALSDHGIAFDPLLVVNANAAWDGALAVRTLLDQRNLLPGRDFDAIAAAGNGVANGACSELEQRGLRIPHDVALVGYDDTADLEIWKSPLTTAQPPFYETGQRALENVMAQISGKSVPDDICLMPRLLIRQSCGCQPPAASIAWHVADTARRDELAQRLDQVNRLRTLSAMTRSAITLTNLPDLLDLIAETLPQVGIPSAYMALFDPTGHARLVLAYENGRRLPLGAQGLRFSAGQLAPEGLLTRAEPYVMMAEPLYSTAEPLGFILLEMGPRQALVYQTAQEQISSALKGVLLFEEATTARAAAEQADRLKTRLMATVSHELRTPLNLILGLSEMLAKETPIAGELRQDVQRIAASAQILDGLIGDVLDLARSEIGQLTLLREPLELRDVLVNVIAIGEQWAHDKGLAWRADLPADLPRIWGDRTRLRQVTLNLLSNAFKFTTQGEVALNVSHEGDTVTVSISDTGLGVPLEEQISIFDEFRQSERTAERGFGGLGLGLAICRRLVELHGGEIRVQSSGLENQGATFAFTLPALLPQAEVSPAVAQGQVVRLLAEDLAGAETVCGYLEGRGYVVEVVGLGGMANMPTDTGPQYSRETGYEGYLQGLDDSVAKVAHIAGSSVVAAIVMDWQAAARCGWNVIKALQNRTAGAQVPVLFYHLEEGGSSLTRWEYLTKPVSQPGLAEALRPLENQPAQRVLVVDDEPGILEMHVRLVKKQLPACEVIQARNGRDALAVMRRVVPSLVLLDLMMPELDGFGVIEAMRVDAALREVPVVVLTGQALTEADLQRLNRDAANILSKGVYSEAETLERLEAALSSSKRLGGEMQKAVRKALVYIHQHYHEDIDRAAAAQHVGLSERHLTRCFQQEMGLSWHTYLNRYRVEQAKKLLARGEANITDVALEVGFSDSHYFARVFQQAVGCSPRAYQKSQKSTYLA